LVRPVGVSDESIVEEAEQEAIVLVGPYTWKEYESFVECLPSKVRVNYCIHEMKASYGPREVPTEPVRRMEKRERGASGSETAAKASDEPAVK